MNADRDEAPLHIRKKPSSGLKLALFMAIGSAITLAILYLATHRINIDIETIKDAVQIRPTLFQEENFDSRPNETLPSVSQADNYEFHVTPGETKWSVEASGRATALWSNELLYIKFSQLKLRSNPEFPVDKRIRAVTIALITRKKNGQWTIVDRYAIHIDKNLRSGEELTVQDVQGDFDVSNRNLDNHWIAIEVQTGTKGTTYAHSREDVFK